MDAEAGTAADAAADAGTGWEFTDDRGHLIVAPRPPGSVVAYIQAAAALWDHGIRPTGIFGSAHDGDAADPAKAGTLPLGEVPWLGAGPALDAQTLLAPEPAPELVVAVSYGGGQVYGLDPGTAKSLEEQVPLAVLEVGGRSLDAVRGRFAELAGTLGAAGSAVAAGALEASRDRLRAAAAGSAHRVLALSPAGPDEVHVARPGMWPDLAALLELGVPLVEPPAGPGANWFTTDWATAGALGATLLLVDARGNASELPGGVGAVAAPWNPELAPSARAHEEWFTRVTQALRAR
ncbi:ABC transporter substrate-binding protein [Streptomyces sp. NPDC050504]|uniref:ABC transporter substrate-binding protein n=1 Tax=Streptomyces sp. NPDC050504 TaxID=3365618 RepID=UPI0037ABC498